MKLSSIIIKIVEKMSGQRSLNASLHVIRGKRSGQTLQDIEYFSVKPYFSIIPKLSDAAFTQAVEELRSSRLINEIEGIVTLTEKGKQTAVKMPPFHFDGWHYRGREEIFFARLLLLVQTLSQLRKRHPSFLPITNDRNVQQFVKTVLRSQHESREILAKKLAAELIQGVEMSNMSDLQATVVGHRLTGEGASGWTWEQLEEATGEAGESLQLEFLEAVHMLIAVLEDQDAARKVPLIHKLIEGIRIETPLTESTAITKKIFDQGRTIEEISVVRQLKVSTIEDHITEMAANDQDFPIERFVKTVDREAVQLVVMQQDTKRLRLLKDQFPYLSYFQLRLILSTMKGVRES